MRCHDVSDAWRLDPGFLTITMLTVAYLMRSWKQFKESLEILISASSSPNSLKIIKEIDA